MIVPLNNKLQKEAIQHYISIKHLNHRSVDCVVSKVKVFLISLANLVNLGKLTQDQYKARHDSVSQILRWALCAMYEFEGEKKWYEHEPQNVLEMKNPR